MALTLEKRLEKLSHETAIVEERLKEAELICGQVVYPAVNELRYLARNLAHVLSMSLDKSQGEDNELLARHLTDAELCCKRANHDITDAIFTYISLEIDSIRKSMGASLIQGHFDNYTEQMRNLQSVHDLMAKSRGTRRKDRDDIYEDIASNYLPTILDFYRELLTNKNLLGEHFRSIKINQASIRLGAIFATFASLLSVLSFFGFTWADFTPSATEPVTPPATEPVTPPE